MTYTKVFVRFLHFEVTVNQITQSIHFSTWYHFRQGASNRIVNYQIHNRSRHFKSIAHFCYFVAWASFITSTRCRCMIGTGTSFRIRRIILINLFRSIFNSHFFLHSFFLLINLKLSLLMQIPHQFLYITRTIIIQ